MFDSLDESKKIIEGAYRKLKSYYYYNKNFLAVRKKIVDFEADAQLMEEKLSVLARYLTAPKSLDAYINELVSKIDIIILPKKFTQKASGENALVSNRQTVKKELTEVNFFIDLPIELHILDVVLCVVLGKSVHDFSMLSQSVYGNTINNRALYYGDSVNWERTTLFNIYFNNYSSWRNKAFDVIERNYNRGKDSLMITMDIKGYFYSIRLNKEKILNKFVNNESLNKVDFLIELFNRICLKYRDILLKYRRIEKPFAADEYCLPIGLMTSMLLSNLYLIDFDSKINSINSVKYYGRYVDDIIIVIDTTLADDNLPQVVSKYMIANEILSYNKGDYTLFAHDELVVQQGKLKIIYIDHNKTRALIDVYNDIIRVRPSQMQPLPEWDLKLEDFDESIYSFGEFIRSNKIRDLEALTIDSYRIGKYFSQLAQKFAGATVGSEIQDVDAQIKKINTFFAGEQGIEYYSQWQNYLYFLITVEKNVEMKRFYKDMNLKIQQLSTINLNKKQYKYINKIRANLKRNLKVHLNICYLTAYALRLDIANEAVKPDIKKYINANMFNHNLLSLPLSNYVYKGPKALLDLEICDLPKEMGNIEENSKFKWSPRFVHFDELLLLYFYYQHNNGHNQMHRIGEKWLIDKFCSINKISGEYFHIDEEQLFNNLIGDDTYNLIKYTIPGNRRAKMEKINICTGNIALDNDYCLRRLKKGKISLEEKKKVWDILRETFPKETKNPLKRILVLPELFYPIELIHDLLIFARKSQIAIVTGLAYLKGERHNVKNYIAVVLPFVYCGYKNATVFIREKNDYSPVERHLLAKSDLTCVDSKMPFYQVFDWYGIDISPLVCFELTDVAVRAILKGRTDLIALSVFNQDTTYFSNIIDSTTRDLHCVIVQANTSIYGDSRVTLPYDRDNKDIFKIKGGDNDDVIVGTLNIGNIFSYQSNYYKNDDEYVKKVLEMKSTKKRDKIKDLNAGNKKPSIKRLSARFHNKRTE